MPNRTTLNAMLAIALVALCGGVVMIALAASDRGPARDAKAGAAGGLQAASAYPPDGEKDVTAAAENAGPGHTADASGGSRIEWHDSRAIGAPEAGRLENGVRFPAEGRSFFTWDPILRRSPDRDWRRWGTDELVRTTLAVLREFRRANPDAPRTGVGDLSLPEGGYFGREVSGGIGHATHQNGLDVDVYYPRTDRRERPPDSVAQVDVELAQELVDMFVDAGAVTIYVGPNLPLEGPPGVVVALVNHDNHLHARIAP